MAAAPGPKRRPLAAVNANCGAIRWGSERLPKPPSAKTALKSRRPHSTHLVTTVTVAPRGGGGGGGSGGTGLSDGADPAALPDPRGRQGRHATASPPFAAAGDGGVAALTGDVEYLDVGSTAASASPADAVVDTDDDDENDDLPKLVPIVPTMRAGWDCEPASTEAVGTGPRHRMLNTVKELFATEKRYLNVLTLIRELYLLPIKSSSMIPGEAIKTIFGNFDEIFTLNEQLYKLMQTDGVIKAFVAMAPYLKFYSIYAQNFERAISTLGAWTSKSSELRDFKEKQFRRPECESVTLEGLLISPVQRMPRYEMLLEGVCKLSGPSDWGYGAIVGVVKLLKNTNIHINNYMKQHDARARLVAFQKQLVGLNRAARLISPGRELLRQGQLSKVCQNKQRGGKQVKQRQCFLCSDIFMYAKKMPGVFGETSYRFRKALWLWQCMVATTVAPKGQLLIVLRHPTGQLEFSADNDAATMEWKDAIATAIRVDFADKLRRDAINITAGQAPAAAPTSIGAGHRGMMSQAGGSQPSSSGGTKPATPLVDNLSLTQRLKDRNGGRGVVAKSNLCVIS